MGEQYGIVKIPKRAIGIEPITTVWKTIVLPLNYARNKSAHNMSVAISNQFKSLMIRDTQ